MNKKYALWTTILIVFPLAMYLSAGSMLFAILLVVVSGCATLSWANYFVNG